MRGTWIAIALLIGLGTVACGGSDPSNAGSPGAAGRAPGGGPGAALRPQPVAVVAVTRKPWQDQILALGTAQANESVTITAKVTETIERVNFQDGDEVLAGAVLVELTGRQELANLREAQAAYEEAQKQFARIQDLVRQGTLNAAALDQQEALRDGARARVEAIRARLQDRVIVAPFAGRLGFRQVSPGTLVQPGTVITTLDDLKTIKLDFTVPETFLAALQPGQEIKARSAAFKDRDFHGTISSIDSRIDPVTRAVLVRARIDNPDGALRPGMLLSVNVVNRPRESLVIPEVALTAIRDRQFVYRVDDQDRAVEVDVRIGARRPGEVEVLDGLNEGDRIVTEGLVRLRNGMPVRIIGDAPAAGAAAGASAGLMLRP